MRFFPGQRGVLTTAERQYVFEVAYVGSDYVTFFSKGRERFLLQGGKLTRGDDQHQGTPTGWFPFDEDYSKPATFARW